MKKNISPSNNFKNLNLIFNSDTYKLAHEDIGLLSRNEMRGVRMLLEITKPDLILEENIILSTIIIFGGASITEKSNTKKKIKNIEELKLEYIANLYKLNTDQNFANSKNVFIGRIVDVDNDGRIIIKVNGNREKFDFGSVRLL